MKPLKIGVTGGIGSGKSVFCQLLQVAGVPVFDTDIQAKRLLDEDEELQYALKKLLGEDCFPAGKADRPAIAKKIFTDEDLRLKMDALVHPAVEKAFLRWVQERQNEPLVAMESAILLESGFDCYMDKVVLVTACEKTRIQRTMLRDGCSEAHVRKRMAAQWQETVKQDRADYVIHNDTDDDINPQLFRLLKALYTLIESTDDAESAS